MPYDTDLTVVHGVVQTGALSEQSARKQRSRSPSEGDGLSVGFWVQVGAAPRKGGGGSVGEEGARGSWL